MPNDLSHLLPGVIRIARLAADALMPFYKKIQPHHITQKKDQSPVTQADQAAHAVIDVHLRKLTPDLPVLSEEGEHPHYEERKQWQQYWLVDPLDGTRGFIRHDNEFTVNIALIDQGNPALGVIVHPVAGDCFYAIADGHAYWQKQHQQPHIIKGEHAANAPLRILCGQFDRYAALLKQMFSDGDIELIKMNSSIKFAALAVGKGDLYCRLGQTSEWDTAAGQCILVAAGGAVVDFDGKTLQYNAKSSLINPPFLAVRDHRQVKMYLERIKIC